MSHQSIRVGFIITARLKSTRLPEKILLKVNDRELLAWMIDRAKLSFCDKIIIATSTNPQDDRLEELAKREGIECFRGEEEDVLKRLDDCSKKYKLDFIVNGIADCPLFGYDHIPQLVDKIINSKSNLVIMKNMPIGLGLFAMDSIVLGDVVKNKESSKTQYIDDFFDYIDVIDMNWQRGYHITLDYGEDYQLFKKIFETFGDNTYKITTKDLIDYLDNHQDVAYMNKNRNKERERRWKEKK